MCSADKHVQSIVVKTCRREAGTHFELPVVSVSLPLELSRPPILGSDAERAGGREYALMLIHWKLRFILQTCTNTKPTHIQTSIKKEGNDETH